MRYLHLQIFTVIIFLSATPVTAQNIFVKAGVNVSTMAGMKNNDPLIGYHLGLGGLKNLSQKLSLKHEMIFSLQGTKVPGNTLRYYYLNVPILLDIGLAEKLSLNAGPQFGITINALDKAASDNITAKFNALDLSFCLGLTFSVMKNLFAEARYNQGVTNTLRNGEEGAHRNVVLQAGAGYFFNRKKKEQK